LSSSPALTVSSYQHAVSTLGAPPLSFALALTRMSSNFAMFRYLRIQAHIHQDNISQRMLDHGSYTFAPGKFIAAANMPLPCETPPAFADVINHYKIDN
jgi:hypothetical protein